MKVSPCPAAAYEGKDFICAFSNDAYDKLTGLPSVGKSLRESLPSIKNQYARDLFEKAYKEQKQFILKSVETSISEEGASVYYDLRVKPWLDGAGNVIGIIGFWHDVTEQKNYEQSLMESQKRFTRMAEGKGDGFWEWDHKSGIIFWNKRCYEQFGMDPQQIVRPEDFFNHVHPDDLPEVKKIIQKHFEECTDFIIEFRGINEITGDYRWYLTQAKTEFDENGDPVVTSGMRTDITDLVLARRALAESEERFRLTFELAGIGIANLAIDGRWLRVNDQLCEVTGYSHEEMLNMTYMEMTCASDLPENIRLFDGLVTGKIPHYRMEKRYKHKDGHYIWVSLNATIVRDENAKPLYVIAAIEDISERKLYEKHLLEENERKNQFLATLAHELRNPLTPIMNTLHMVDNVKLSPEKKGYLLDIAKTSMDNLTHLIDDLLDITRINKGKIKLEKEPVVIQKAIQSAIYETQDLFTEKMHQLIYSEDHDTIIAEADRVRLIQVFSNILNNAAKYTPPEGTIKIHVGRQDDFVTVSIEDNGPGIPEDMLGRIFDIFTQVEQPFERSEGGLGIGLSLVKEIISLHDGRIEAENLAKGSRFIVKLPVMNADD